MSTIYSISHTDTSEQGFIINPSQINGEGGPSSNSSLILHGTGRLKYGEAINENFLHLLENFASPARVMPLALSIQEANNNGIIGTHFVKIFDDKSNVFIPGFDFQVVGSTSTINDGNYIVNSSSYDKPTNLTTIVFNEAFTDDQASFLGNVSYHIVEPEPNLVKPPYNVGQLWYNKTDGIMYVYKDISGTGILQWDYAGRLGFSNKPPQFPNDGDLWYDPIIQQLKIYQNGAFESVADRYVLKSGDILDSNAVLSFGSNIFLNEGAGDTNVGATLRTDSDMLLSSNNTVDVIFDNDNNSVGEFKLFKGSTTTNTATGILTIKNNGVIHSEIPTYESLLTDNNDIPNKMYIDTAISNMNSLITGDYLLKTGDTTTGILSINGHATLGTGDAGIIGDGYFGLTVNSSTSTNAGGVLIQTDNGIGNQHGIELVTSNVRKYDLRTNGDQYLYGTTSHINGSSLILDHDPVQTLEAATKGYVDDSILAITDGDSVVKANPVIPEDGDIRVTGTGVLLEIFIYGNATWNKIFPAVYSA